MRAVMRISVLAAVAGIALFSAYVNANDETGISADLKLRYICAWSALPIAALSVYLATTVASKGTALSFKPVLTLLILYAIVFSYAALNGPTNSTRGARTQFIFIPMILGVFSLPFLVFMLDRIVSIVRKRLRGEEPAHGRRPQETR